jgi:Na+/H+-dicarboxylate symporter
LRRYKDTVIIFSSAIFWGLFTALILSFVGLGLALVIPFEFSAFSSASSTEISLFDFSTLKQIVMNDNAFKYFTLNSETLLPLIIIAVIIGIALRPDREAIRPAYVVVNSFAEGMLRLARIFTVIGPLLLLFISAQWFSTFPLEVLISSENLLFAGGVFVAMLAALFIVLPLLFGLFTLFKGGNPYSMILGSLGALIATGFSGNFLFGTTPILALSQKNCGVRKRVGGISIPILTMLGRGGSAMIATYVLVKMLQSLGTPLFLQTLVFIALFSALFSLVSSFSPGFEVIFILLMIFQWVQADSGIIYSSGILLLLPILRLTSLMVDTMVTVYGAAFGSRIVSPADQVSIEEMM